MDIESFNKMEDTIKNLTNPLLFIYNLYINKINNNKMDIIFRLLLKYHDNIMIDTDMRQLFNNNILNRFYFLLTEKIKIVNILKRWHEVYKNKEFWLLSTDCQIDYLLKKRIDFKAAYDITACNIPFHIRVKEVLKNDLYRNEMLAIIEDRLVLLLDIFGYDVFKEFDLLIRKEDFYNLTNQEIYVYLSLIYNNFNHMLQTTIKLFKDFNFYTCELENLIDINSNQYIINKPIVKKHVINKLCVEKLCVEKLIIKELGTIDSDIMNGIDNILDSE